MITAEEFAQRLQDAMQIRGIGVAELAQKCGSSSNMIYYLVEGRNMPSAYSLDAISTALNVDLDYLFARQDMLVRAESIEAEDALCMKTDA